MNDRSSWFEITPRHLIFNVLASCAGPVNRATLMHGIYNLSSELAGRGYRIALGLKGSEKKGWWAEDVDGELRYWISSGLIGESQSNDDKVYEFKGSSGKDAQSPADIMLLVNADLDKEVRDTLQNAARISCQFAK